MKLMRLKFHVPSLTRVPFKTLGDALVVFSYNSIYFT